MENHNNNHDETVEDNFEIINRENISASIMETYIRSDHYTEPLSVLQKSVNAPSSNVEKEKELEEKKCVYIDSEIYMSGKNNRQAEHKAGKLTIGNPMDDEIVVKVIEKVTEMQTGVNMEGKSTPGGAILRDPGSVISTKKIKITQQMIEVAYQKLRTVMQGNTVDAESVAIIVAYSLQIANEMLSTSKTYKVELALAIIRKLIDDEIDDQDQRVMMHMIVESTVPRLINTIHGLPSLFSKLFAKCQCIKK